MEESLSKHAKLRIKERAGKSLRSAQLALERGLNAEDYSGSFRRYLDKVRFTKRYHKYIKIYANDIYIFDDSDNLVTVLNIPSKYLKVRSKHEK